MLLFGAGLLASAPSAAPSGLYVAVGGNDAGAGTIGDPLATLAEAASRLAGVGGNVWVRAGRYGAQTINSAGTVGTPINIESFPGEVARFDVNFQPFQTVGNTAWELDPDSDPSVEVYRSLNTGFGTGSQGRGTFWVTDPAIGRTVLSGMRPYESLAQLRSTNYKWQPDYVYYGGPGFHFSGGRVYVRIQNLASPRNAGVPAGNVVNPLGDLANHPPSSAGFDPRNYEINIADVAGGVITVNGLNVRLKRLDIRGGLVGVKFGAGVSNVLAENCNLYALACAEDNDTTGSIDCTLYRCRLKTGMSPCFSWNELHTQGTAQHPRMEGKAWRVTNPTNALIDECEIESYFDGSTGIGDGTNGLIWRKTTILYSWDDMWQWNGGAQNLEMDRVYCRGSGPGWNGGGNFVSDATTAKLHHSIVDARDGNFGWRLGMENNNGGGPAWRPGNIPFPTHSATSDQPAKIYNMLVIYGWHNANDGCRWERLGAANTGLHETRKSIAVAKPTGLQPHSYIRNPGSNTARAFYDGNILPPNPVGGWSSSAGVPLIDYPGGNYASLAAWLASPSFNGWEANSKQVDPQLGDIDNLDFRPSPIGPAATGAPDLSGTGWPGATADPWFGPVDPNAATGMGGVGIPPGTPIGP